MIGDKHKGHKGEKEERKRHWEYNISILYYLRVHYTNRFCVFDPFKQTSYKNVQHCVLHRQIFSLFFHFSSFYFGTQCKKLMVFLTRAYLCVKLLLFVFLQSNSRSHTTADWNCLRWWKIKKNRSSGRIFWCVWGGFDEHYYSHHSSPSYQPYANTGDSLLQSAVVYIIISDLRSVTVGRKMCVNSFPRIVSHLVLFVDIFII